MTQRDRRLKEAKDNYVFYKSILKTLNKDKHGKYLLLKDREVIDYYSDIESANAAATSKFEDGIFSIQKVAQKPVELGFYRYAHNFRNA